MATNQFGVVEGCERTFEVVWDLTRDRLREAPGFVALRLEKGPVRDSRTLYFVITMWESEADFLSWKRLERYGAVLRAPGVKTEPGSADPAGADLDAVVSRKNPQ